MRNEHNYADKALLAIACIQGGTALLIGAIVLVLHLTGKL